MFENDAGNEVPIPSVIVVADTTVKLPTEVPCVLVRLNAVVPVKSYPDGYKFHKNTPDTTLPPSPTNEVKAFAIVVEPTVPPLV